jgi:hypothetical protein
MIGTIQVPLIVPRLGETAAVLTLLALAERDFRLPTPAEGAILAAE